MSNLRGVFFMVGSMAAYAAGDALIKAATGVVSPAQGLVIMALFGTLLFAGLTLRSRQALFSRDLSRPVILFRNVVEGATAICFFSAFASAPLSLVVSITQAVPLLVTIGAAVILREHVGPRRWSAIFIGLVGVLIMLRPWEGELATGAIWALFAALGLATRDLAARFVPNEISTLQLATWATASLLPAGLLIVPFYDNAAHVPASTMALLALAAAAAGIGYYFVTAAMRAGDASLVAPFRYTRLPIALMLAIIFLGERPDAVTLVGAAIVIGSGLFVLTREARLAR